MNKLHIPDSAVYAGIMAVYIFVIILVGVLMGRKSKKGSDYFLGGRSIGPWVTAFSFIAAYFSSVLIIGGGGFGYKFGLGTMWIGAINVLVGCFMAWMVLGRRVRRMTQKLDTMTIPEFFAERFGSQAARIFAAAIIMIFLIVYNVSVLKGMGNAFEVLMGWPYTLSVLISGVIILLYVAIGGYLAVVWTSFIQAWVMIFGLIFLTVFALIEVGGLTQLNLSLSAIDPGLIKTPGVWGWAGLISFSLIVSFGVWGMPQLIVRFYSIKKARLIKLGAVLATVGGTVALLPYLNGAIARVLYPGLESADLAIPTLTRGVLPAWAGGLLLAGVIAAGMSTFAAVLIIVSSSVVRDVMQKGMKMKFTEKQLANGGRIVCVVAGLVSLLIALKPPDLVLVITGFSWAVIASTNLWPILFGIYWKRASKIGVLASMISGAATALVWQVLARVGWSPVVSSGIHGFIPGMIVGLVVIIVVSLLTKKPDPRRIKRAFGP